MLKSHALFGTRSSFSVQTECKASFRGNVIAYKVNAKIRVGANRHKFAVSELRRVHVFSFTQLKTLHISQGRMTPFHKRTGTREKEDWRK